MEIQLWREILAPYSQAVDELLIKFNHIIADYKNASMYSPIEAVTGRVKTISSILDKLQKKNIPMDQIVEEMDDIAGIRIMCQFVEDIYKVVEIIRSREDMEVREEKDYISNFKASGYRSYHMIIKEIKKEAGSDLVAAKAISKEATEKMFAELTKGQDMQNPTITPEAVVDAITGSISGVDGVNQEALDNFNKALLGLMQTMVLPEDDGQDN